MWLPLFAIMLVALAPDKPAISSATRAAAVEFEDDGPKLLVRLQELAAGGDDSASEFLGEIYHRGGIANIRADPVRGCDWFEKTAERRGDSAQNFANCFFWGDGRRRDLPRARVLYRRAMNLGWPSAACALGNMLVQGAGGSTDVVGGVALCRTAAEAGNADAQTDLGNYLLAGVGVPKSIAEARRWYERAADQGQGNAAFVFGQIHWNGDGTPVDRVQAAKWWRVAYEAGRKDAASLLAKEAMARFMIGEPGRQVVQFDHSALLDVTRWLNIAALEDPSEDVRRKSDELLKELTKLESK